MFPFFIPACVRPLLVPYLAMIQRENNIIRDESRFMRCQVNSSVFMDTQFFGAFGGGEGFAGWPQLRSKVFPNHSFAGHSSSWIVVVVLVYAMMMIASGGRPGRQTNIIVIIIKRRRYHHIYKNSYYYCYFNIVLCHPPSST